MTSVGKLQPLTIDTLMQKMGGSGPAARAAAQEALLTFRYYLPDAKDRKTYLLEQPDGHTDIVMSSSQKDSNGNPVLYDVGDAKVTNVHRKHFEGEFKGTAVKLLHIANTTTTNTTATGTDGQPISIQATQLEAFSDIEFVSSATLYEGGNGARNGEPFATSQYSKLGRSFWRLGALSVKQNNATYNPKGKMIDAHNMSFGAAGGKFPPGIIE